MPDDRPETSAPRASGPAAAGGVRDGPRQGRPDHHLRQAGRQCAPATGRGRQSLDPEESEPVLRGMMMRTHTLFPAVVAVIGVMIAGAAHADIASAKATVDAAKLDGVVGEQSD